MSEFVTYLERAGLSRHNFRRMELLAENWLAWLATIGKTPAQTNYADLLDYIGHLQQQGKSKYVINRALQTISHYYRYCELEDVAFNVRMKGMEHKAVSPLFKAELLDTLYNSFETVEDKGYYHHSDKLILGLMIYQALEMSDIERLELHDLDLAKGVIHVPSGRLKLERTIPLVGRQILGWSQFVSDIRPGLLEEPSDRLLAPQCDRRQRLHHQLKRLSKRVKSQMLDKLDLRIVKLNQLRQSRIAVWVEQYGLRKAQYLSGLRRIQSVERYRRAELEDLQRQVGLHHPLRK